MHGTHVFFHDLFGKLEINLEDFKKECINSGFRCFFFLQKTMSELNFNFLVPDPCITEKNSLWAGINSGKNVETSIFLEDIQYDQTQEVISLIRTHDIYSYSLISRNKYPGKGCIQITCMAKLKWFLFFSLKSSPCLNFVRAMISLLKG